MNIKATSFILDKFVWKCVIFQSCLILLVNGDIVGSMIHCHDDPTFVAEEGILTDVQFTWLGGLQYIHVLNGTPHYFRQPRVVLVSRLFVISTAADASNVPHGYALGNIIFGEYERDEEECGLTTDEIARGSQCNPAVLLIPIADVLVHPEYKHFGMKKSLALLKLLKPVLSQYMLPVCLPLQDFVKMTKRDGKTPYKLYHIDYTSPVPRDFDEEEKEVAILQTLPQEMCYIKEEHTSYELPDVYHRENSSDPVREICTTSCGLRSGAPTIVHEHTGHWTVVALAEGGSPCPDPFNQRQLSPPPVHILIHPYVPWITAAITGHRRSYYENSDPFGFQQRAKADHEDRIQKGWIGKWWMGGIRCYDRAEMAMGLFRFYHEVFLIHPNSDWENKINYYIEIEAPIDMKITCIKVGIPHRLGTPTVWGLETPSAKIRIQLRSFHLPYKIEIEAWGYHSDSSQEQ